MWNVSQAKSPKPICPYCLLLFCENNFSVSCHIAMSYMYELDFGNNKRNRYSFHFLLMASQTSLTSTNHNSASSSKVFQMETKEPKTAQLTIINDILYSLFAFPCLLHKIWRKRSPNWPNRQTRAAQRQPAHCRTTLAPAASWPYKHMFHTGIRSAVNRKNRNR